MLAVLSAAATSGLVSLPAHAESGGFSLPTGYLGYVVLALIGIPVVLLVSSAVLGAPRGLKVPGLFLVCLGLLISATIVGFALIGKVLGFVIPS